MFFTDKYTKQVLQQNIIYLTSTTAKVKVSKEVVGEGGWL